MELTWSNLAYKSVAAGLFSGTMSLGYMFCARMPVVYGLPTFVFGTFMFAFGINSMKND